MIEEIIAIAIAVFIGGVVVPVVINVICDKKGWFK
jgi:hypothetical protein